jgi:hypothetical protein
MNNSRRNKGEVRRGRGVKEGKLLNKKERKDEKENCNNKDNEGKG